MKNKGMHQQPNAFSPSTGGSAPQSKHSGQGGFSPNPTGQHGHGKQESWNKPKAMPTTTSTMPTDKKGFNKNKKAA